MINRQLHLDPVALDRQQHRHLKIRADVSSLAGARAMNSFFVNAVEFADAAREYPIVFVPAGPHPQTGQPDIAPMVVLGLSAGENLYFEGDRWLADYVPALLRAYPFAIAGLEGDRYALTVDRSWAGLSQSEGRALFDEAGEPTPYLADVQKYLEALELEIQRTRAFGQRLGELGLLQSTRFDATLPDGNTLSLDGFMAIDEAKLKALPDAVVVDLHRSGLLALIHAQQLSMGHMRRLVARRAQRTANA